MPRRIEWRTVVCDSAITSRADRAFGVRAAYGWVDVISQYRGRDGKLKRRDGALLDPAQACKLADALVQAAEEARENRKWLRS